MLRTIWLFWFPLSVCSGAIPLNVENYGQRIYQCIEPLINHSDGHQATSFYYSIPDSVTDNISLSHLFKLIGAKVEWSGSVVDRCNPGNHKPMPTVYMLFVYGESHEDVIDSIREQLTNISCNEAAWKPDVQMIVILIVTFEEDIHLLARTSIHYLWKCLVYHSTVVVVTKYGESGEIYAADPFHRFNRCGHHLAYVQKLFNCSDPEYRPGRNSKLFRTPDLFPNCTITISVRLVPPFAFHGDNGTIIGSDLLFVNLIKEKFDINPMVTAIDDIYSEQQFLQQFQKRHWKTFDIALGGYPLMVDFVDRVIYSRINAEHRYFFYLSEVDDVTGWQALYNIFLPSVWYSLAGIIFASILILHFIKFIEKQKIKDNFSPFLLICGLILQQSRKIPSSTILRSFLFCTIPVFFLIGSLYTSILHSFTINPAPGEKMKSLKQLYAANLTVSISPVNSYVLKEVIESTVNLDNFELFTDIESKLRDISLHGKSALLESNQVVNFMTSNQVYDIYRLNELVYSSNIGIVLPEGSLIAQKMYGLIDIINENGLYRNWLRYYTFYKRNNATESERNRRITRRNKISCAIKVLTVRDLAVVFLLLVIGYTASVIVFIAEYICGSKVH